MRPSSRSIALLVVALVAALVALEGLEPLKTSPRPLAEPLDEPSARAARATTELESPSVEAPRATARPPLDRSDPRFRPRRNESVVGGWIETESGAPAAHATAVLLDARGNVLAEDRADAHGVFYVGAKASGTHRLVALHPGFLPRCVDVELVRGAAIESAPIALASGATIRGRVASEHAPIARAEVEARPTERGTTLALQAGTIVAREDGFVWARVTAESNDDGHYTLRGLPNEAHRVTVAVLRGRENALDLARVRSRVTAVPASDVDFALPSARLEIAVTSADEPLAGVEVQINAGGQHITRVSDENGLVALRISPAVAYPLVASRAGYATTRAQLRGLIDGEERRETLELALEPHEARKAVWNVEIAGAASGEDAHFLFRALDARAGSTERAHFTRRVARSLGGERFELRDLVPGTYEVTISTGGPARASTTAARSSASRGNCDVVATIVLAPGETLVSRLAAQPLALLDVEARAFDGTRLRPTVRMLDVTGDRAQAGLGAHAGGPILLGSSAPSADEAHLVTIGHCGGVFELHVEADGYHPLVETLSLEGSTRQRVSLVLTHR